MKFCFSFILMLLSVNYGFCLSERDKIYAQVSSRAANILEKQFGLHCCGTGCKTNEYIEKIALSFQVNRELNQDEARKLILAVTNQYITILNADQVFRPYMVKYPYDEENVEVTIYFKTKGYDSVFHPKIRVAYFDKGSFKFCTVHKSDTYSYRDRICETYSEALEKAGLGQPSSTKSQDSET